MEESENKAQITWESKDNIFYRIDGYNYLPENQEYVQHGGYFGKIISVDSVENGRILVEINNDSAWYKYCVKNSPKDINIKPIKPSLPSEPHLPEKPEETIRIKKYTNFYESTLDEDYPLKEILDTIPEHVSPDQCFLQVEDTNYSHNCGSSVSFRLYYYETIENPELKERTKQYIKKMEEYRKKKMSYDVQMFAYNEHMKEYQVEYKKWKKLDMESQIEKLKKQLEESYE